MRKIFIILGMCLAPPGRAVALEKADGMSAEFNRSGSSGTSFKGK